MFPSLSACRGFLLMVWVLSCATGLSACTPTFDWRELRPDEAPMLFLMPAKASSLARDINLDGLAVKMQMYGAKAGDHTFTAAWVDLEATPVGAGSDVTATTDLRHRALEAMQVGMLRNIGAGDARVSERTLALVDAAGESVGRLPARQVGASGHAGGRPVQMRAIFAGLGPRLYQFVVLGESLDELAAATFLDSVRLRAMPAATPGQ